jgi:excisionase family DNA binding protein
VKTKVYNTLNVTARMLGLPAPYIRKLAEHNKIPVLKINDRLRFNPDAVKEALDRLAEKGGKRR